MKKVLLSIFILAVTYHVNSQTIELPNTVITVNYNYANSKDAKNTPACVKKLEESVYKYKTENLNDLYDEKDDICNVSFKIANGKIIASYDKDGKIVETVEKYNNVRLPLAVMQSVSNQYPSWGIIEDVYIIKYNCTKGLTQKEYKIKIKNEDEVITIKTNEKGDFI